MKNLSYEIYEAIKVIKPDSYEFIPLGPFMIVNCDLKEPIEQVTVSQDKQIERLEKEVNILDNKRHLDKIKSKFESSYQKFFESLNNELHLLETSDKQYIKVLLENMSALINDTIGRLTAQS